MAVKESTQPGSSGPLAKLYERIWRHRCRGGDDSRRDGLMVTAVEAVVASVAVVAAEAVVAAVAV